MFSDSAFLCILFAFFAILFTPSYSLVLEPIHPSLDSSSGIVRRDDPQLLDLKSVESFLWGSSNGSGSLANLTVYMPGLEENILSMERFDGLLKSVECNNDSMSLGFNDDAAFLYAQQVWDWVDGADNHSFIMVAGPGSCQWNQNRQPFSISHITYDEDANVATLVSQLVNWTSIIHTFDLLIGSVVDTSGVASRDLMDYDKDFSIDMAHAYPWNTNISEAGLTANIECTENCKTTGSISIEAHFGSNLFDGLSTAEIKLVPKGLSATAEVKLSGGGNVSTADGIWGHEWPIATIPLNGLSIPNVLDLGPEIQVELGLVLNSIVGNAEIAAGASATIADSASLTLDLKDASKNVFSGWMPTFSALPVDVDADISGDVSVYIKTGVKLSASILGKGYDIGLALVAPSVNITAGYLASEAGVCGTSKTQGVQVDLDISGDISVQAQETGSNDALFDISLAGPVINPLGDTKCITF